MISKIRAKIDCDLSNCSEEKYFWLLRDCLISKIKSLGLKKHDFEKRRKFIKFKIPDFTLKLDRIEHESKGFREQKEKNQVEEKIIFDTYEEMPDLKVKRLLTDEEFAVLKEKLGELEAQQRKELDGQIRLSRNKFMIRSRFGKTQKQKKRRNTKKQTV